MMPHIEDSKINPKRIQMELLGKYGRKLKLSRDSTARKKVDHIKKYATWWKHVAKAEGGGQQSLFLKKQL